VSVPADAGQRRPVDYETLSRVRVGLQAHSWSPDGMFGGWSFTDLEAARTLAAEAALRASSGQ
jgi:hypothetical protein